MSIDFNPVICCNSCGKKSPHTGMSIGRSLWSSGWKSKALENEDLFYFQCPDCVARLESEPSFKTSLEHLEGEELIGGWIEALDHCLSTENYGAECEPDQLEELTVASLELLRRRQPEVFYELVARLGSNS